MQKLNFVKLSLLLGLGLVLASGSLANAQDKSGEQKEKDLSTTIELYSTIMAKTFEKANIEDAQMDKIKDVIDRCIPELVKARNQLDGMLTKDQKRTYAAAIRQAVKAKYTQPEAEEFAMRKLKLTKEKLAEYKSAKSAVDAVNQKMNDEIEGLLTEEQRARLPMFSGKRAKLVTHKVKFPGMKTDDDAKKIEDLVKSIKGSKTSEVDVASQAIRIDLPNNMNLEAELNKLLKADNKILEGWQRVTAANVIQTKNGSGAKTSPAGSGAKSGK